MLVTNTTYPWTGHIRTASPRPASLRLSELLKNPNSFIRSVFDTTCAGAGGANRSRTGDLLRARQALSQLSYGPPIACRRCEGEPLMRALPLRSTMPAEHLFSYRTIGTSHVVGLGRFELPTSPLSGVRSNQLSYRPATNRPEKSGTGEVRQVVWALTRKQASGRHGKEVIQPQVPLRLPCYDFTPVMNHTVVSALPKVKLPTSGTAHSHGMTGGVYKARERIHRSVLICDY